MRIQNYVSVSQICDDLLGILPPEIRGRWRWRPNTEGVLPCGVRTFDFTDLTNGAGYCVVVGPLDTTDDVVRKVATMVDRIETLRIAMAIEAAR